MQRLCCWACRAAWGELKLRFARRSRSEALQALQVTVCQLLIQFCVRPRQGVDEAYDAAVASIAQAEQGLKDFLQVCLGAAGQDA